MNELESYIRMSGSNRLAKFCFTDLFNRLIKFIEILAWYRFAAKCQPYFKREILTGNTDKCLWYQQIDMTVLYNFYTKLYIYGSE